jgi:hypothetical protein
LSFIVVLRCDFAGCRRARIIRASAQRTPLLTLSPQHALVGAALDALLDGRGQMSASTSGGFEQAWSEEPVQPGAYLSA